MIRSALPNGDIQIRVERKKRKTLSVRLCGDGSFLVSVPLETSEKQIAEFISAHKGWILKAYDRRKHAPYFEDTPQNRAELKEKALAILTAKTDVYASLMRVCPKKISVRFSRTRFGSCSSGGNISFSAFLILYPEEAVDYVVVHELAHLKYMNHSKAFYAYIERFLPDYRERIKLLK